MKPIQKIIDVQKVASEILVHNMMECNFTNTKDLLTQMASAFRMIPFKDLGFLSSIMSSCAVVQYSIVMYHISTRCAC